MITHEDILEHIERFVPLRKIIEKLSRQDMDLIISEAQKFGFDARSVAKVIEHKGLYNDDGTLKHDVLTFAFQSFKEWPHRKIDEKIPATFKATEIGLPSAEQAQSEPKTTEELLAQILKELKEMNKKISKLVP
jgi:uncharacterized protein (UPF0335 family)